MWSLNSSIQRPVKPCHSGSGSYFSDFHVFLDSRKFCTKLHRLFGLVILPLLSHRKKTLCADGVLCFHYARVFISRMVSFRSSISVFFAYESEHRLEFETICGAITHQLEGFFCFSILQHFVC